MYDQKLIDVVVYMFFKFYKKLIIFRPIVHECNICSYNECRHII